MRIQYERGYESMMPLNVWRKPTLKKRMERWTRNLARFVKQDTVLTKLLLALEIQLIHSRMGFIHWAFCLVKTSVFPECIYDGWTQTLESKCLKLDDWWNQSVWLFLHNVADCCTHKEKGITPCQERPIGIGHTLYRCSCCSKPITSPSIWDHCSERVAKRLPFISLTQASPI